MTASSQIVRPPTRSQGTTSLYGNEIAIVFRDANRRLQNLPELLFSDTFLSQDADERLLPHNVQIDDLDYSIMQFTWGDENLLGLAFKVSILFQGIQGTGTLVVYQPDSEDRSIWHYHFNSEELEDEQGGIYNPNIHPLYRDCPSVLEEIKDEATCGTAVLRNLLLNPTAVQIEDAMDTTP